MQSVFAFRTFHMICFFFDSKKNLAATHTLVRAWLALMRFFRIKSMRIPVLPLTSFASKVTGIRMFSEKVTPLHVQDVERVTSSIFQVCPISSDSTCSSSSSSSHGSTSDTLRLLHHHYVIPWQPFCIVPRSVY